MEQSCSYQNFKDSGFGVLNKPKYLSKEVNQQLSYSSNILLKSTSFFKSAKKKSIKKKLKNLILNIPSKENKIEKKITSYSYSSIPGIKDREKLGSFYISYQEDDDNFDYYNNNFSKENDIEKSKKEKNLEKKKLFSKYRIFSQDSFENSFSNRNASKDKEISTTIKEIYFNNIHKANKIITRNKQLVSRMNDITNYFLIQKYNKNINLKEKKDFFLKKMPKINVRKMNLNEDFDYNYLEKERSKSNPINGIRKISIKAFKKLSFNGMLAVNNLDYKKIPKRITHQVNCIISYITPANKPYSRTDFTVNKYKNKIYLFGGLSSGYLNDIWEYDLILNKWNKITKIDKNNLPVPRYGHSSIILGKYIVIFGGSTPKLYHKEPEKIVLFDLNNKIFIYPNIKINKDFSIRRNHICVATTSQMLIYGGMDVKNGKILNTAYIFSMKSMNFYKLKYTGITLPYLMNHSGVMVNKYSLYTNKPYSFYKIPENDLPNNRGINVIIEGVYIFGGQNEKGDLCNKIYIITIGEKPCKVIKPNIDGIPPKPRMSCKMEFILNYDFIIIHGGTGINNFVYNDIIILNTQSLNWITPIFDDDLNKELTKRTEHCLFFDLNKIYILGGRDANNYLKMDFECVSFEITNF